MSANPPLSTAIRAGFDQLHASWGWFVALGIALIVLGAICILGEVAPPSSRSSSWAGSF